MAMSDAMRLSIFSDFAEMMGEEKATAFMESISPIPWHSFATKDDVYVLKGDIAALKEWAEAKFDAQSVATQGQFAMVVAEFNRLRGEITRVEGNLSKEIAGLANQIAEQSNQIAGQTRTLLAWMAGFALTVCAALVGGGFFA